MFYCTLSSLCRVNGLCCSDCVAVLMRSDCSPKLLLSAHMLTFFPLSFTHLQSLSPPSSFFFFFHSLLFLSSTGKVFFVSQRLSSPRYISTGKWPALINTHKVLPFIPLSPKLSIRTDTSNLCVFPVLVQIVSPSTLTFPKWIASTCRT